MKKLFLLILGCQLSIVNCHAQDQHKKDSLFAVLKTAKEDTDKVMLLVQYAYSVEPISKDSSIYYLHEALMLSKKTDFKRATTAICVRIADYHESNSTTDSAIFYSMMWLTAAKELNDSIWIGNI